MSANVTSELKLGYLIYQGFSASLFDNNTFCAVDTKSGLRKLF